MTQLKSGFVSFVFCTGWFLLTAQTASAQSVDLSSPEKTIRSFLDMVNKSSMPLRPLSELSEPLRYEVRASSCVFGSYPNALTEGQVNQLGGPNFNGSISDLRVDIEGDRATATFVTTRRWTNSLKQSGKVIRRERLQLQRRAEGWKILPAGVADTPFDLDLLTPLLYQATALSHVEDSRQVLHLKTCGHDLFGLCLSMDMFLQKHEGKFALKANNFMQSLLPYFPVEEAFNCPADDTGQVSYSFNENLTGVSRAAIVEPRTLVMIYEGKDGRLDFRHSGHALIGFANLGVRLVSPEEARSLRWKP